MVYKALKHTVEQLPTLSTLINDSETEKPQLVRTSRIDLEEHVRFLDQDNVQSLLEHAHNDPLTHYETRPQWRLYITTADVSSTSFHVAFATSHALADGMSGFIFHKAFLQSLHDSSQLALINADSVFEPSSEQRALPPALEDAGNLSISWSFLVGPLVDEFCPVWLTRMLGFSKDSAGPSKPWCGAAARPSIDKFVETAVHVTAISPGILRDALAACRKHDARLTGLLNHVVCRALARSLHARGQEYNHFTVETALDLRRCLPAEYQRSMGNFPSAMSETIELPPSALEAGQRLESSDWKAIQDTTRQLSEKSSTLADQAIGLLKFLSNYRQWTIKRATTPAEASFGVSNLGTFDRAAGKEDTAASCQVREMVFSQSADGTGPPFNLNVASGKHGSLMLVVTWMTGMLGVEDEKLFVQDTMQDVVGQLLLVSA